MEMEKKSLFHRLKRRSLVNFSFSCFSSSSSKISSECYTTKGEKCIDLQNIHGYSYRELEVATNGFSASNKIGEGGFGSVYKGRAEDGKCIAVKVLSAKSKQGEREYVSEIASLSNINHKNLVKLHGACIDGPIRILVYDFMGNGNLAQLLLDGEKSRGKLKWKTRREISLGIGEGLAHIHEEIEPHIVHRDIKATNILLDHNFAPKISDFGLSKLYSDNNVTHISTRVAGTLGYLAPEYAISGHLTRKSDIYSFGVLLLEIVSGRQLGEHYLVQKAWEMYKSKKLVEMVDPKLNLKGKVNEEEAVRFIKVALLCVQEKIGSRPKLSKALKMMTNEINITNVEITKPAIITDFMNVKTCTDHRSHSSQTISSNASSH